MLEQPYALLDLAGRHLGPRLEPLQALGVPIIGIAPPGVDEALAQACDVIVDDAVQAATLIANIERNPIASAVLVQLLRATASLPLEDALNMESLAYSTLQSGPEFARWLRETRGEPAPGKEDGPAVLLRRDGDSLSIELNRPTGRNAMSVEMRDALVEALELALADDSISDIRISGRGKCFSTGGELSEFGTAPDPATAHIVRGLRLPGRLLARCAARASAYVHGASIGSGIEFPAFAGKLIAAPGSFFQLPELHMGLIPGAGGCLSLARRIGRQRTAWLVLSGRRINAARALQWGLVDSIEALAQP